MNSNNSTKLGILAAMALIVFAGCKYEGGNGNDNWEDRCTEYKCGSPAQALSVNGSSMTLELQTYSIAKSYNIKVESAQIFTELAYGKNVDNNLTKLGLSAEEAMMITNGNIEDTTLLERMATNLGEPLPALLALYHDFIQ